MHAISCARAEITLEAVRG